MNPMEYFDRAREADAKIRANFEQLIRELRGQVPEAVEKPGQRGEFDVLGVQIRLALQWGVIGDDQVVGVVFQSRRPPLGEWSPRMATCALTVDGQILIPGLEVKAKVTDPIGIMGFAMSSFIGVFHPCEEFNWDAEAGKQE